MLEHHFAQDIEELRGAAGEDLELDVIDYSLLRSEALRVLPDEVKDGLEAYASPELEMVRHRYGAVLREILEDRFAKAPFDAVVLPSDTFFYVRAAPAIVHSLGVPLLVAQKETTISEHTMLVHAPELRELAPPIADRMTVCSERHKRFWVRAGADPERIEVTGQPRFDFYGRPQPASESLPAGARNPCALFLSYATDAYHPDEGSDEPPWEALHMQTEQQLLALAERGWCVLIKPHPQQPPELLKASRLRAGDLLDRQIFFLKPGSDVRPLILAADVTIGFQSTAMLEAMLAGRPVLYTGWDETALALGQDLIPFHRWSTAIDVLRKAEDLVPAALSAKGRLCAPAIMAERLAIAERYLGPLDGLASHRTISALRREAEHWAQQRSPAAQRLREQLIRQRGPRRLGLHGRIWMRDARRRAASVLGR